MNVLPKWKQLRMRALFVAGVSSRHIEKELHCSKPTIVRYRRLFDVRALCGCGSDSGHKGWCAFRFQASESRQLWMSAWHASHPAKPPQPRRFRVGRFRPGPVASDPLLDAIRRLLPNGLPPSIRDEVLQDLAVRILSESLRVEELSEAIRPALTMVWRRERPFELLSLSSVDREGRTLGDRLGAV